MTRLFVFITVASIVLCPILCCGQNPLLAGRGGHSGKLFPSISFSLPLLPTILTKITEIQKDFRESLTFYAKRIKEHPTGTGLWYFLAISFAYGVVHALGPGHGKCVVCSYFLATKGNLKHGFFYSSVFSAIHVFSPVVLILGILFIGRDASLFDFDGISEYMYPISYLLVAIVGLSFLLRSILHLNKHDHDHHEDHGCETHSSAKGILALALAAGLIPCSGAAIILLFSLSMGILWAGLIAMVAVALGMALTTSLVAAGAIGSRGLILTFTGRYQRFINAVVTGLMISGPLLITLLGLILFVGSLHMVNLL